MKHKRLLISGLTLYGQGFQGFADDNLESIDGSALYEVWWPEHVTNAQFNGDCDYCMVEPNDYRTEADITDYHIYGDSDTWNMLSWFSAETLNEHCN